MGGLVQKVPPCWETGKGKEGHLEQEFEIISEERGGTVDARGRSTRQSREKQCKKERVLKSFEVWVREEAELCEAEARRARLVARKAREMFDRNLAKMLEKDDTKLAADRMWQASQSNEMKKRSLLRDFEDLVAALDQNGWDKDRGSSAKMWGTW